MARLLFAGFIALITPVAAMAVCAPLKLPPEGSRRSDIVTAVMPAVVQVQARFGPDTNESYEEALGDAMRETQASTRQSLGSGFIVSGDGLVVTNEHVVAQAKQITVRLADGSLRGATLVGSDERTDIALLRMEALARCYPALSWADSDKIRVGEDITAVGSPFGLGGSVSAGIISGRGRTLGNGPYHDFLQIDAAINQGNSGGPLLDTGGRVVGINTAILAPAGGNIGIGFSLPAAMAQRVIAELLVQGKVSRTQLGLSVESLTGDIAEALGLSSSNGVLVIGVEPGSPADRVGIAASDVVLSVDGRAVTGMGALSAEVATFEAGRAVQLQLWRNGKPLTLELLPVAKPDAAVRAMELVSEATPDSFVSLSGLRLAGTTQSMNEVAGQTGSAEGLIVVEVAPNSPGAARGIAAGDIITGLAGKPLASTVQFTDAIADTRAAGRRNILITLLHGKNTVWMALPIDPKD
jgi:serine protease Do